MLRQAFLHFFLIDATWRRALHTAIDLAVNIVSILTPIAFGWGGYCTLFYQFGFPRQTIWISVTPYKKENKTYFYLFFLPKGREMIVQNKTNKVLICLRLPCWKGKSCMQYLSFLLACSRCTCFTPLDKCLKERLINRIILKRWRDW